jgi:hypothetical protein
MNDDNSILETSDPTQNLGPESLTNYLGSLVSSINQALDPTATLTKQAAREFQKEQLSQQHSVAHKGHFSLRSRQSASSFSSGMRAQPQPTDSFTTDGEYTMTDEEPSVTLNASFATNDFTDDGHEMMEMDPPGARYADQLEYNKATRVHPREASTPEHQSTAATLRHDNKASDDDTNIDNGANMYDDLMRMAAQNMHIMETMRNQVNQLRVENALLLNDMHMITFGN